MKASLLEVLSSIEQQELSKETIELIVELLLPGGVVGKEEVIELVTSEIIQMVFNTHALDEATGLNPEILMNTFKAFKNLEGDKTEDFTKVIKELFSYIQKRFSSPELSLVQPLLDILSTYNKNSFEYWKVKKSSLDLVAMLGSLTQKDNPTKAIAMMNHLRDFTALISSHSEGCYDIETGQLLQSKDILQIITQFFESLSLDETLLTNSSLANIVYLGLMYSRPENYDVPVEVAEGFEKMLDLDYSNKDGFLSTCLNIKNAIWKDEQFFVDKIDGVLQKANLNVDQDIFTSILYYAIRDAFYIFWFDEGCFDVVDRLEFVGFLRLVFEEKFSISTNKFLGAVMKRLDIYSDRPEDLPHLIAIFTDKKEANILGAAKALHLESEVFLLIGKGLLNPAFISEARFIEVGISDPQLLAERMNIFESSSDVFISWKQSILSSTRFKEFEARDYDKARLIKTYFTDWDDCTFSRRKVIELVSGLTNRVNMAKIKSTTNKNQKYSDEYDLLASLCTIINDLKVVDRKKHNSLNKGKEESIKTLAGFMNAKPEDLKRLLEMFLVKDPKIIFESVLPYYKSLRDNKETGLRLFISCSRYLDDYLKQKEYIQNILSDRIDVFRDRSLQLPAGFYNIIAKKRRRALN